MPAITINDLSNAKLDVDHISDFATTTAPTVTDRLGNVKPSIAGLSAEYPNASVNAAAAAADALASEASRQASGVDAGLADAARVLAEAARDSANTSGKSFTAAEGTAAGIAATTSGQNFSVLSADSASWAIWRNNAGVALLIGPGNYTKAFIDGFLPYVPTVFESLDPTLAQANLMLDPSRRILAQFPDPDIAVLQGTALTSDVYETLDTGADEVWLKDANGRIITKLASVSAVNDLNTATQAEITAARGTRTSLATRVDQHINPYGMPKRHQWGEWYTRETRQRLRKRLLAESTQLVVASIGDSWTHAVSRWTGPTASTLKSSYGDAGPGWTGFAWGFGGLSAAWSGGNGCVSSEVTVALTANWAVHYGTSSGPDICDIYSSTVGSKVTTTFSGTGNASVVKLHYIAGAGAVQYRWNAGAWTALDLSIGSGATVATLTGLPTGTWTLEIENVSGVTTLCGVDVQKSTDGVRWHKLGATGSQAQNWVNANAAQWQGALTALVPHLVIIMLATNDQGAGPTVFKANVQTLITRIRTALPLADIVLVCPCENGRVNTYPMTGFASAMYELAAVNKCGFMDLQYVFGETFSEYASTSPRAWFNADTIHPEPATGGRVIVDAVTRFLTN